MFSHPAFLHPISEMRSGFPHGRYSGSAHLRGHRLPRLYPAFSGFPNDRIVPLRIQTSALTATGIARISTGSLISASGSLGQSKTRDTVQHLIVNKQISGCIFEGSFLLAAFHRRRDPAPGQSFYSGGGRVCRNQGRSKLPPISDQRKCQCHSGMVSCEYGV